MTQAWPTELREQLEQQKAELTERVDKIKKDITGGLEADSKEQATQLENREVLDALAIEATEELVLIKAALINMDNGTYGACAECGEDIASDRLKARPYSAKCIDCAELG
jgi:DnaK suppressor protein